MKWNEEGFHRLFHQTKIVEKFTSEEGCIKVNFLQSMQREWTVLEQSGILWIIMLLFIFSWKRSKSLRFCATTIKKRKESYRDRFFLDTSIDFFEKRTPIKSIVSFQTIFGFTTQWLTQLIDRMYRIFCPNGNFFFRQILTDNQIHK